MSVNELVRLSQKVLASSENEEVGGSEDSDHKGGLPVQREKQRLQQLAVMRHDFHSEQQAVGSRSLRRPPALASEKNRLLL